MNKKYFESLKRKLQYAYADCIEEIEVSLNRREVEDLYYLWKDEACKKWKLKDASCEGDENERN